MEDDVLADRIAARLVSLRAERGWSIDDLAARCGISRSTLSRIERGETHPTATALNEICAAHGLALSSLLYELELGEPGIVRSADQEVWTDPASGFRRRSVSPPHPGLRAELIEGELPVGAAIDYRRATVHGLEQHLWLRTGALTVTVGGLDHRLDQGDCLRFRVTGPTRFAATGDAPARYLLAMVRP